MAGKNSQAQFKETWGASSTTTIGAVSPESILIVGHDIPLDDTNQDCWDEARLIWSLANPIDPQHVITRLDLGGKIPAVDVIKRDGKILAVDGRRRIIAARAANRLILAGGGSPDELIEIQIIPLNKGADVEVCVRGPNAGRLDDPPYVSAKNAARLRARGKDNAQIAQIMVVTPISVTNWFFYLDVDPAIRAMVEDPNLNKSDRLPFAMVVELGKLCNPADPDDSRGPEQYQRQATALDYLRRTNAPLTGERGRENAKAVVRALMSGEALNLPRSPNDEDEQDGPILIQVPPGTPGIEGLTGQDQGVTGSAEAQALASQPGAIRQRGGATGQRGPTLSQGWHLTSRAMREVFARIEPTAGQPLKTEADRVAYAVLAVVTGQDPHGDGLKDWPYIQNAFKGVVRSPVIDPDKCQNPTCDRGHDTKRKDTCKKCEGTGKAPAPKPAAGKKK
jgi:hypothetical protein